MAAVELTFLLAFGLIVGWISYVDYRSYRIPDPLNAALFIIGIGSVIALDKLDLTVQLAFSASIFLALYLLRLGFEKLRGRTGLGLGDVKLGGAIAVWINPLNFPFLVLIASGSALLVIFTRKLITREEIDTTTFIPFGPFLGGAGLAIWLMQINDII